MKREILFRGKRLDNCEWTYGYFVRKFGEVKIIADMDTSYIESIVDPATIGQFTGLADKNGVKIFEGDVIHVATHGFDAEYFKTAVVYADCAFRLKNGRSMFYFGQRDMKKMSDAVVIGNIYDNPDLEGKE